MAERVFKLEVEQRTSTRTGQRDYVCREGGNWVVVPYYGSLGASVKLELRLAELGWKVQPSLTGRAPGESGLVRAFLTNGTEQVIGAGTSFELALCRAGLNAAAGPAS